MSFFCYISRSFSYRRHSVSFKLQLIWGNAIVRVVARVFTLSFVPRTVLTKLKTTTWCPFFWSVGFGHMKTTSSLWTVNDNAITHLNNSIVFLGYHLQFLKCLQRSQGQQRTLCACEKPNFRWKKNAQQHWIKIASLSKRCQS